MKKLLFIFLLPLSLLAQDSWVRFQVQFDFYAPSESNFFMISDAYGDTSIFFQPTIQYEYLDTILPVFSGSYTLTIMDSFGDGWVSTNPASFKMGNDCQGDIINWDPVLGSFFQRDTTITILPCPPPPPPGPPSQCVPTTVIINLDQYPSETSWDIKDSTGATVLSGGPYGNVPNYQPQIINNCLLEGDLTFTIYDMYGDGLSGSLWGGQDGSYYVVQCGDTLVYGDVANFGLDSTHAFTSDTCIPPPLVYGCMDYDYLEFDPSATASDSTYCATLKIFGCTDTTMFNYDPLANSSDFIDSCLYMLVMNDLIGNGWVGTDLIINELDTFTLASGFTDTQYVWLQSPAVVEVTVEFLPQTDGTATECGWSLTGPDGFVMFDLTFGYVQPSGILVGTTNCGNSCDPIVIGCMDSLAVNYIASANTNATCYYYPGCSFPAYLEYHVDTTFGYYTDLHIQDSCINTAIFGCTDLTAFNYDATANVDNGGCLPVVLGCMQPLAFNYNPIANTTDTCIAMVFGCTNSTALNYDSLANVDDGSCLTIVLGCTDPLAFNYQPLANVDDGSCVAVIYGCMDATAFNFNPLANSDNGSCIAFVYGCTDSTAFNYNPLANADNSSCVAFIYGCTDPSALNYSPSANTEDFSCIAYVYGCMDSLALNFDSLANTDNGSCITIVMGCMDITAYNYDGNANTNDSLSCRYSAGCATGDSIPYWLNDPCYAWVIDVDNYCCQNEWDDICQATYDYCGGTWIGPLPKRVSERKLISITDVLGRPAMKNQKGVLIYIYNDGTTEKYLRHDK